VVVTNLITGATMTPLNVTSYSQTALEAFVTKTYVSGLYPPTTTSTLTYRGVLAKRDIKNPSSNHMWPQFKGLQNCTNPYSRYVCNFDVSSAIGSYSTTGGSGGGINYLRRGDFLVPFGDYISASPGTSALTSAFIKARLGITNKYNAEMASFSGGTALGELKETFQMLRSPAKALRNSIDHYRKDQQRWIRKIKGERLRQAISGTYLEWTFGAMPLISDVASALEAIRRLSEKPNSKTLSFSVPYESYSKVATNQACYNAVADGHNEVRVDIWCKQSGGVRFKGNFIVDVAAHPGRLTGLDLDSFVPTVYNLLPYSFLVDYFSNVGDVLNAACSASARHNWLSATYYIESEWRAVVIYHSPKMELSARGFVGPKSVMMERTVPSLATAWSDFEVSMPGFDSDAGKWLNIAALIDARAADAAFYSRFK
jgi:hypothetical protein